MNSPPQRHRDAVRIVFLALILTVVFVVIARLGHWQAQLAESNFQANLIRLQAFLFGPPPRAVLVGSSLSGRLLPGYFEGTSLAPLDNLGLDGSGPLYGLNLALARPESIVIIEANNLLRSRNENDLTLDQAVGGVEFRLGGRIPALQAQWRPSSVLYSWMKLRKTGDRRLDSGVRSQESGVLSQEAGGTVTESTNSAIQQSLTQYSNTSSLQVTSGPAEELREKVKALQERGCRVVFVRLPTGQREADNPAFALSAALARELKVPELDLRAECAGRGETLSYTDGLHLTPGSAREVSRLIAELIQRQGL